ncbi:MAG: Cys-tRNA(Pro) deacylase [Candidatus Delongbacteria bacterium]|nr:Cys-tRNA(Pro) deacylase [bacterium]MBL7032527.1 Cys-tRNA(Pro) deacylase [Candidatus Delongbacteria bacterium]
MRFFDHLQTGHLSEFLSFREVSVRNPRVPVTTGIRWLRTRKASFETHLYNYEEHGGTGVAARESGAAEFEVVKTVVLIDTNAEPLLMLMHGDREVSLQQLARQLGVRAIQTCPPAQAQKITGYLVGGTSPFGTRRKLRVFAEKSIMQLSRLYINGGKRGLLIEMTPRELVRLLHPVMVQAATKKQNR